jgi:hypothetical protein
MAGKPPPDCATEGHVLSIVVLENGEPVAVVCAKCGKSFPMRKLA